MTADIVGSLRFWQGLSAVGILGAIAIWVASHSEQVSAWYAWVARLFAWLCKRAERTAVSEDIHATVNRFAREANDISPGILPYRLRIEWQRSATREAFLREGHVVVKLDYHQNQARNIALATSAFVASCTLPLARPHLDAIIRQAVDITITRKVLVPHRRSGALSWFAEYQVEPAFADRPGLREACGHLDQIDEGGLFLPVLLREFDSLGNRLVGDTPRERFASETKEFVGFLVRVVERERGEDINPVFYGQEMKVVIVMVARREKITKQGCQPYHLFISTELKKGAQTFYVLARGPMMRSAEHVARFCMRDLPLIRKGTSRQRCVGAHGTETEAVCIVLARQQL